MPLKLHWKSYPHHHLPRFRFASKSRASSHNRSHANAASSNVLKRSLSSKLVQEREKTRFKIGRRRRTRSFSSAVRVRYRRDIQRARQYLQIFGWDMQQAHIASQSSGASTIRHDVKPSPAKTKAGPPAGSNPEETIPQSTLTTSNDGAAASCVRKSKGVRPEELYSLMHVTEVPVYWQSSKRSTRSRSAPLFKKDHNPSQKRAGEFAHAGSLGMTSRQNTSHSPKNVKGSRTYDRRIDPGYQAEQESRRNYAVLSHNKSTSAPETRDKKKSEGTIRRKTDRSKSRGSRFSSQSMKSAIHSLLSDAQKRSPSQVKALRYFTKELELYLQATQSLPKKSLIPSPSATTVSANTVEEFRPYRAEFEAAGLAVTSDEQRGKSSPTDTSEDQAPPTPPKNDKWEPKKSLREKSKLSKAVSSPPARNAPQTPKTSSAGTTEMEWTPPYEAKNRETKAAKKSEIPSPQRIASTSPSPPNETASPKSTRSPARSITKKSLPWLHQSKPPTQSSSSPTIDAESRKSIPPSPTKARSSSPAPATSLNSPKAVSSKSAALIKANPSSPAPGVNTDALKLASPKSATSDKTEFSSPAPVTSINSPKSASTAKKEFSCTITPSKVQSHKSSSSAKTEFSCPPLAANNQSGDSIASAINEALSKKAGQSSLTSCSSSTPKEEVNNADGKFPGALLYHRLSGNRLEKYN
jgi:hypothetical protein